MAQPGAADMTAATPTAATAGQRDIRVPVHEEQLVADKRQQEQGRVHVRKDVVEEQQTVSAPVTHEEVQVERVPTEGRPVQPGDQAFQERDIEVPVRGEELVTGKQTRVKHEVRISKQPVTEQQQASDTVRKERVNVERTDDQGRVLNDQQSGMPADDQQTTDQTP